MLTFSSSLLTVGLLIGPRGNTLKKMETESGAKIAIRGKGSVKEGKGKSDAAHASNQDEDLHCLIMADTEEKINKAKKLIHNVIETVSHLVVVVVKCAKRFLTKPQAASIPEGQNELKRNQLRELAALNGTLRDDENQACANCGEIGHRKYDCPQARNFTANIICRVCGNAGHMARDCPDRTRGGDWRNQPDRRGGPDAIDKDYQALMNDLEQASGSDPSRQIGWQAGNDTGDNRDGQGSRPWQRGGTAAPAPWEQGRQHNAAPWQQRGPPGGGSAPWGNRDHHHGGNNYDGGYNSHAQSSAGGPAPWLQNRGGSGGSAPWQTNAPGGYGGGGPRMDYNAPPPPPPPGDVPPPPPPSDIPPPPPPA